MIAAPHLSQISDNGVLIVGRTECHLKCEISLKQTVKPITISDTNERSRTQVIRGVADRNGRADTESDIVMMNLVVRFVLRECNIRNQKAKRNQGAS